MINSKNSTGGFALIEVLLAVVILAIGLLAGSKMQILGIHYTQGAMSRSHAALAASDIIDRMRLNPDGVAAGAYDGKSTETIPADPGCTATGCTSAQLANLDLRMWARHFGGLAADESISTALPPGAKGTITREATGKHTIHIEWSDHVQGKNAEPREINIGVTL